jgi:hypothetical protein
VPSFAFLLADCPDWKPLGVHDGEEAVAGGCREG